MHIAFANQWYPPETGGGGVATHYHNVARAFSQLGHRVTVIAARHRGQYRSDYFEDGVHVLRVLPLNLYPARRIPLFGRQYRFAQALLHSLIICRTLGRVHREVPVDVAEFADVNAEGFFWSHRVSQVLAIRCHTPTFVLSRYYTRDEMPYATSLLGWAERRTIRRANVLTAPSHDMARVIATSCSLPLALVRVVPNAVEFESSGKRPDRSTSDGVTVLFVGRLERAKGIEVLAEAIPLVLAKRDNVRFVIAGPNRRRPDGTPSDTYLRTRLSYWVEEGRVVLKGFVPDNALIALYREADIAVVPSLLYESFSLTVAQAMAAGLPVIASAIGGIPETLGYGTCGILTPPGDVLSFTEAITMLVDDASSRQELGELAQAKVETSFASSRVSIEMAELYAKACGSISEKGYHHKDEIL